MPQHLGSEIAAGAQPLGSPSRTLRTAYATVCHLCFIVVILPSLGTQTRTARTSALVRIPQTAAETSDYAKKMR